MSRTVSGDSRASEGQIVPVSWNSSPVPYSTSINIVDPAELVLRSQNDLLDLGSPVPRVLPNPCAHANYTELGLIEYQAFLVESGVPEQVTTDAFAPRNPRSELAEGDPWRSETAHNSQNYGPGYSNFLPPYGPMARYDMQEELSPWPVCNEAPCASPKPKPLERVRQTKKNQQRRKTTRAIAQSRDQWEHNFAADGSMKKRREGAVVQELPRGR